MRTFDVLMDVDDERTRQDARWGEQNHPDGTDRVIAQAANDYRRACDLAAKEGKLTWRHIALEEVYEALAETDPKRLRAELVQCAAVFVAWIEKLDREAACGRS